MRDKLAQIYNALLTVETKGTNTMIMADCLRALYSVIQELEDEQRNNHKNNNGGSVSDK